MWEYVARKALRILPYVAVLLAWGLRLCCLESVPPGWRDDELINIFTLSGKLLEGRFPLYFTGASGHEPLYHYLHAGAVVLFGFNTVSGRIVSVAMGVLSVAAIYPLARRLYGRTTAAIAGLALAASFWSLMYSRFGMRHISMTPLVLVVLYLLWMVRVDPARRTARRAVLLGVAISVSMYIYTAARILPALVIGFALYLALAERETFRRGWRGYALALIVAALLTAPLALAIRQGRSDAAAAGIGADARLVELAAPIYALREGDPSLLLETTWNTLLMFHATGDPESLYNIPGRPLFNSIGALAFWAGMILCLARWRHPRYLLLPLWLGIGLLPTVLSVPPASLGHSILILPLTAMLPALALVEGARWLAPRIAPRRTAIARAAVLGLTVTAVLLPNIARDLGDYFVAWPADSMVRYLYRADYRDAARYVDAHPEQADWAISSLLMGPWDRVALGLDARRDDLAARLFSPDRALVYATGETTLPVLLTWYPPPASTIEQLLGEAMPTGYPVLTRYTPQVPAWAAGGDAPARRFANGLELTALVWEDGAPPDPGHEALLLTAWRVAAPLDLPPMPLVANPPPPGVYSGPRLAVFAHLLAADESLAAVDDGLWVDPLTLRPGDRFVQIHRLALPADAPAGPYTLQIGLYDPKTGERIGELAIQRTSALANLRGLDSADSLRR